MTRKGEMPKDRKLATTTKGAKLTANQWQNTPQQHKFMEHWLEPSSKTFGNAYQSALQAGYGDAYASQISSPAVNNKWIQEYTKRLVLSEEHIVAAIQNLALNTDDPIDSRSPADTRLKALEILSKIKGMIDQKHNTTNVIVQPILGGLSKNPTPPKIKIDNQVIDQIDTE